MDREKSRGTSKDGHFSLNTTGYNDSTAAICRCAWVARNTDAFADQAVAALRDAVKAGWAQLHELKEPDFDVLRGREDFKKLAVELESRMGPKAKQ
jgi:hypothetical protein